MTDSIPAPGTPTPASPDTPPTDTSAAPTPDTSGSAAPTPGGPVLVLVAMAQEAAPLHRRLEGARAIPVPLAGASARAGRLAGQEVVVLTSGIGVAAATAATTWGILTQHPRLVIDTGSCGGLAADIEVGTVVVGSAFTWSLADATAFGYAPGQVPGGPVRHEAEPTLVDRATAAADHLLRHGAGTGSGGAEGSDTVGGLDAGAVRAGLMLSGDAFVTAPLAGPLRERFPEALTADMETTAIARTCEAMGVPFLAVRTVSDLCGPAAGQQFHLELEVVAERSAAVVEELLRGL
ncbi:5'-methylthioadenosine/S-adenosylhomocysteine nucleosidase [Brachybacterium sillae]|uniref:5'-methylthioadenosine/S-adenosylhomocysteine nucleosidase n=1 Tax=Brachybacterium sillae TaxID=2810536 RepID=UPI00255A366F|nr:5'-methylthioadenosine/S-adenosylhomocysteine nucleosidase [Brachybacterium sillae]